METMLADFGTDHWYQVCCQTQLRGALVALFQFAKRERFE
jgi:hypothetical protein